MAYTTTSQAARLLKAVGNYVELAAGIATATTTTLTVTVPSLSVVMGVVANSLDSATSPVLASTSGNTFTMTTASGDKISWLAWGIAKI